MSAVWFIFVVALLNTGLGFALAVHLGGRYRAIADPDWDFDDEFAWPDKSEDPSASEPTAETGDGAAEPEHAEPGGAPEEDADHSPTPAATPTATPVPTVEPEMPRDTGTDQAESEWESGAGGPPATEQAAEAVGESNAAESRDWATEFDEAGGESPAVLPTADIEASVAEDEPFESSAGADSTDPDVSAADVVHSSSGGEEAIEAFLAEVEQYHEQLDRADGELRCQADDPDGDSIRACLESLLEASREYAEQRERARVELDSVRGERPEFGVACGKLDDAVTRQDRQIESTERAIAAFPYTDDLARGCHVMTDETTKLMDANISVRDALHEVGVAVARGEGRLADLEARKRSDSLTGAESRAALENALLTWMGEGGRRTGTLTLAAVDVDEFSRINREFGHTVGNQLLHALGQLLITENRSQVRLARFSGERFVLLFSDSSLRDTTNAVERLRQIVELACFEHKRAEIQITVSCGVAEATGSDTPEIILARAEATLMEAKRYGRNRTFIHEGKYPTPVVPPKFPIQQRRMTL